MLQRCRHSRLAERHLRHLDVRDAEADREDVPRARQGRRMKLNGTANSKHK